VRTLADLEHARRLLFGLNVDAVTLTEAVAICERALTTRQRLLVGVVNAAKVVKLNADQSLRESLLECDLLLADGQSVVWASRFLGRPLPERVAGIDLFESLLDLANRQGYRVYLLGATANVLATLEEVIRVRWPGIKVAGSRDGYFKAVEGVEIAADIASSGADMLFLGMGTPAKELFLARYADGLGVPIMHGVGGSFDVLAGVTRRAPDRWQRWGMEWAYRLLQEPRRLWRRYLVTNTAFLFLLLGERIRQRPAYTIDTHRIGSNHG
jgi:N-acetylglucosaminyldiphosphoundecaprenol N-acetyl-beta-D-mannosaminyltransferase